MAKIWINAKTEIIDGNENWDELASRNKANFLKAEQIAGASFLSFITGDAVRMFLDAIIIRVLVTGKSYMLHYRCDSGTKARFMKMLVNREGDEILSIEHEFTRSRNISRVYCLLKMKRRQKNDVPFAVGLNLMSSGMMPLPTEKFLVR